MILRVLGFQLLFKLFAKNSMNIDSKLKYKSRSEKLIFLHFKENSFNILVVLVLGILKQ